MPSSTCCSEPVQVWMESDYENQFLWFFKCIQDHPATATEGEAVSDEDRHAHDLLDYWLPAGSPQFVWLAVLCLQWWRVVQKLHRRLRSLSSFYFSSPQTWNTTLHHSTCRSFLITLQSLTPKDCKWWAEVKNIGGKKLHFDLQVPWWEERMHFLPYFCSTKNGRTG